MTAELHGKIGIVTGGTSGIGRDTAVLFAKTGAKVVVAGRREAEGKKTRDLVRVASGDGRVLREQTRRDGPDQDCGARKRAKQYPSKRGVPRGDRDAHGGAALGRTGGEEVCARPPSHRPFWNGDGNRGSRRVDVLGPRILHDRPVPGSRRRISGGA